MSKTVPTVGSFEFLYVPSKEALKEVIEILMRKSEELM